MAKRRNKAKRSLASLPKGLPQKNSSVHNPFEVTRRQRRVKHEVVNRFHPSKQNGKPSKLAMSLQRRKEQLRAVIHSSKKSNSFVDRRIGENTMSHEDQMLARLVKERSRRSRRASKYQLDDDDDGGANDDGYHPILTHRGKAVDDLDARDHVILSSDDEDGGNLEAEDTELHFGGMGSTSNRNPYGPSSSSNDAGISEVYSRRKTELDDLIAMRKSIKAEKMLSKEKQVETFESMDESFKELSQLLDYRDKEKERAARLEAKRKGQLSKDEQEMAEWDKEMKTYLFERRVKATDRTKTPEEIAKEEAERLQELETRRLARMNGDFDDDDFSDISDNEDRKGKKRSRKQSSSWDNAEALGDGDGEGTGELKARFTADGLVYTDENGNVVKRASDPHEDEKSESSDSDGDDDDDDNDDEEEAEESSGRPIDAVLPVGTRVRGNYRAKEQFDGNETWYEGKITEVTKQKDGTVTYDVEYDDGDFEEGMEPQNVQRLKQTREEKDKAKSRQTEEQMMKQKRQKAAQKARTELPFVFEVPTTLEMLHELIGQHASTGKDVSLIIQRIHKSNSVRLNKRNTEKMQNFYDVLLRRFIAVGDAIHTSGDGGEELGRYEQLNALTKILYAMSQDSPESAAAVWGRRLGIFQNAHAKRLRDAGFVSIDDDKDDFTAWPSTGTLFLLRALGHIFPVTDRRHRVVTPALLLLGQMVAQTPVRSLSDLVCGLFCCGLMVEYTKEAKRVAPEAMAFLAGVLRLFSKNPAASPVPTLQQVHPSLRGLREAVSSWKKEEDPMLSLENTLLNDRSTAGIAILNTSLHFVRCCITNLEGAVENAESEIFFEVAEALLDLKPKKAAANGCLPKSVAEKVAATANAMSEYHSNPRPPLQRRTGPSVREGAIKSLAPRLEDPSRYSLSKDKKKSAEQAALDRIRREYKREHKAVSRELRMDAAFVEEERRREKDSRDGKARAKRQKNFAWLEGEQASLNQQVRQGGGLLAGGGMGAARAKARSGKIGYKKGGKF